MNPALLQIIFCPINHRNSLCLFHQLTWSVNQFLLCFLPVYYQSNEWAGVYGIREGDHQAWSAKQDWSCQSVEAHRWSTSSSSCSRRSSLLLLPLSLGRTSSSSWTLSSSCAASWHRGLASSRHAGPPTSAASDLHGQTITYCQQILWKDKCYSLRTI